MSANEMREHLAKAKVIAHRGASAFCPENTLSAFVQAAEMGAAPKDPAADAEVEKYLDEIDK